MTKILSNLVALLATTFIASSAFANGPYEVFRFSTDVSCSELNDIIDQHGAVVVWESANPAIYQLRVAHGGFCESGDRAVPDYVETASGSCLVYACMPHGGGEPNSR